MNDLQQESEGSLDGFQVSGTKRKVRGNSPNLSIASSTEISDSVKLMPIKKSKKASIKGKTGTKNVLEHKSEQLSMSQPSTSDQLSISVPTSNRFDILPNDMEEDEPQPVHKPPPIKIKDLTDFCKLCMDLSELIGKENFHCASNNTVVTLHTYTSDAYRCAVKFLDQKNYKFHTYQAIEDKAFRIVVRYLHHTTPHSMIKEELQEKGFSVRNITNVLDSRTKRPLNLFFIDLDPSSTNRDIFNINRLAYSVIKIEEPYKRREIVQCHRCQEYGHTRTFCRHNPRCVKCGQGHSSEQCTKRREEPARCALCGGDHPANYKGCRVHVHLQSNIRRRDQVDPTTTGATVNRQPAAPNSYSQAVRNGLPRRNETTHTVPTNTVVPDNYLTYTTRHDTDYDATIANDCNNRTAQLDCSTSPDHQHYTPPHHSYTTRQYQHATIDSQSDITSMLSTFMGELKSLIIPLITLLTTTLSKLIPNSNE